MFLILGGFGAYSLVLWVNQHAPHNLEAHIICNLKIIEWSVLAQQAGGEAANECDSLEASASLLSAFDQ